MSLSDLIDKVNPASAMRWVFIFTYIITIVGFMGVWIVVCVKKGDLADIPNNVWLMISSILGIITTGKVIQMFPEEKGKANELAKSGN